MQEKDAQFLEMAFRSARDLSQDANTQTGAVIVNSFMNILSEGANRMHYGMPDRFNRSKFEKERKLLGRPEKYSDLTHAERDAIYEAVRGDLGLQLRGATMYCTWTPCVNCAEVIINSGIKRVVTSSLCDNWYAEKLADSKRVDWGNSIKSALNLLGKCGVKYECLDIPLSGIEIRFDDVFRKID
jgi:deoxycytidylate deaminase